MVVVKLIGGLGNQMFQYAAAKALSLEKAKALFIDVAAFEDYKLHRYELHHFQLVPLYYKSSMRFIKKLRSIFFDDLYYCETNFNFDSNFFALQGDVIYLKGYFQSEKYFTRYEAQIRKSFEIKSDLKPMTQTMITRMKSLNSVALHIRRGDYLLTQMHNTNKDLYYKNALAYIESKQPNPVYFVFSDDIDWVKLNFTTKHETVYVDFNDALSGFEDIKLMSSCKHNIIANSSFSWWGAWLNENPDKIVIAPEKWFNDDSQNTDDIIPDNWIKL